MNISCVMHSLLRQIMPRVAFITLLIGSLTSLHAATAEAEWTLLVYVQANNSLCPFAQKNFNDMATVGSNKDLNILVQWYDPSHAGIWRYKIERSRMVLDTHLPIDTDGNGAKDLVESMNWAASKYPAKKYGLVLWNHGIGILDPVWGQSVAIMNSKHMGNNPRITIDGITHLVKKNNKPVKKHRGILFNERSKTYMDNQTMSSALATIKNKVLKGKKIDLIGMDACLMSMVEVAHQIKDYAHVMVGSQEVELAYGWNYGPIMQRLAANKLSPAELAGTIVTAYEGMYKNKVHFYTQSAIDLGVVGDVSQSVGLVAKKIMECREADLRRTTEAIKVARTKSLQFSSQNYIDLHSFLTELNAHLTSTSGKACGKQLFGQKAAELRNALEITLQFIEAAVIANAAGKYLAQARGMSIYFPAIGAIDQSYDKTDFAAHTRWADLLRALNQ